MTYADSAESEKIKKGGIFKFKEQWYFIKHSKGPSRCWCGSIHRFVRPRLTWIQWSYLMVGWPALMFGGLIFMLITFQHLPIIFIYGLGGYALATAGLMMSGLVEEPPKRHD